MIDLDKLVEAIERQEGFREGTLAWKNNNPGNIKIGKFARSMGAIGRDMQGHAVFPDAETGRNALRVLLQRKFAGKTLREIGAVYAEDPMWAENVSKISAHDLDEVAIGEGESDIIA
jgi:hypothetical protein